MESEQNENDIQVEEKVQLNEEKVEPNEEKIELNEENIAKKNSEKIKSAQVSYEHLAV